MANGVAIIEDSLAGRLMLRSLFSSSYYDAKSYQSTHLSLQDIDASVGLIVLGPSVERPEDCIQFLRRGRVTLVTPCVVLLNGPSPQRRLDLIQAGAREILDFPAPDALLLARARSLLREAETFRETERRRQATLKFGFSDVRAAYTTLMTVSWVAERGNRIDPPDLGSGRSWKIVQATVSDALSPVNPTEKPSAYVLDRRGSDPQSPIRKALPELRARTHSRHSGIMALYADDDTDAAIQALDSGATEVVAASVSGRETGLKISRLLKTMAVEDALRRSAETSMQLAVTDPLTGLFNRRYAEAYLLDLLADRKADEYFAVMIADIDHFKLINDRYGHAVGDQVLQAVAERLRAEMRAVDLVARYGGEEFLIILSESNLLQAKRAANRVRQRIGREPVELRDGRGIDVTMSIGVCLGSPGDMRRPRRAQRKQNFGLVNSEISSLLERADSALYTAKAKGRNRVRVAPNAASAA